jgi:hypothetical protein
LSDYLVSGIRNLFYHSWIRSLSNMIICY